jgi:hypothetical protein
VGTAAWIVLGYLMASGMIAALWTID